MTMENNHPELIELASDARRSLLQQVGKKIVGQEQVIELMLTALFARAIAFLSACQALQRPCL